jgi:6-phosphofructokinase 1
MTSERAIIKDYLEGKISFDTDVPMVTIAQPYGSNHIREDILGVYRPPTAKKAVLADMTLHKDFSRKKLEIPGFLEAGPRETLLHNPHEVQAAIVTVGGLAPGLHCVIHSIVKRHIYPYGIHQCDGRIYGVYNSYRGLCSLANNLVELSTEKTAEWLNTGGAELGIVRYFHEGKRGDVEAIERMVDQISTNLQGNEIDILYVLGGDGSLMIAHEIAINNPECSVVGIPKTMDNDVLWVDQSFGFDSAVEQATHVINVLYREAQSTRRICLIELFGAESGFVAANATLASGYVDLVLIPEVFTYLEEDQVQDYLNVQMIHIKQRIRLKRRQNPHAVIVVAEGVGTILEKRRIKINGKKVTRKNFIDVLSNFIEENVQDANRRRVPVFVNQPRHHIRAVAANSRDHIYCDRLGALAVDNALAGYTDFMISQWRSEFVLVPLALVKEGQKSIPINGMFWKQVMSSTGQPLSPAEVSTND